MLQVSVRICCRFLWGYLKDKVYAQKPATFAHLRATIERECTNIPRKLFHDLCHSITSRCLSAVSSRKDISLRTCDNNTIEYLKILLLVENYSNYNKSQIYNHLKCVYILLGHPVYIGFLKKYFERPKYNVTTSEERGAIAKIRRRSFYKLFDIFNKSY